MFVDLNGALMQYEGINCPERLVEKGFYELRVPEWNMVSALKSLVNKNPELRVMVIAYVPDSSAYARAECSEWVARYFRCAVRIKYISLGEYFGNYVKPQVNDILISMNAGDLALFATRSKHGIGVDYENGFINGIACVNANDTAERIEGVIRGAF